MKIKKDEEVMAEAIVCIVEKELENSNSQQICRKKKITTMKGIKKNSGVCNRENAISQN